jgi:hypothetical protein
VKRLLCGFTRERFQGGSSRTSTLSSARTRNSQRINVLPHHWSVSWESLQSISERLLAPRTKNRFGFLSGLVAVDYPTHHWMCTVTHCGRICYKRRKINLSQVFAGQDVGVKQVSDRIWLVTFMDYDLGYFDDETCRLEPIANPFGPKVLPMSPE